MQEVFEKIIDQLKAESIIVDDEAGNRAVEIIEQAAAEYNNGWIPVEERLPEDGEEVLATDGKYVYLVEYDADLEACFGDMDGIVAWQPLPEPYQPKGECQHIKPTNADRIRSMSDEELAKFMANKGGYIACCQCDFFNHDDEKCEVPSEWLCTKGYAEALIHKWLQSEAEVES